MPDLVRAARELKTMAGLLGIKTAPDDYAALRAEYRDAIAALLLAYVAGTLTDAEFNAQASTLIQKDIPRAARLGNAAQGGGVIDQAAIDDTIKAEIANLQNAKAAIAEGGIDNRAELYARTLDATYSQAALDALPDTSLLRLVGPDGLESCETCQRLKRGEAHPLSWWNENMLIPAIGNTNYDCQNWRCQHFLEDSFGNPVTIGFD